MAMENFVNLPPYIVTQVVRRLEGDLQKSKLKQSLELLGLSLNEPGPAPDLDFLEEQFVDPCESGSIILEATLVLFGESVPIYFRVNYAGNLNTDCGIAAVFGGPAMSLDLLSWDEDSSQASWSPIGSGILSASMMDTIWALIAKHAAQDVRATRQNPSLS